MTVSSCRRDEGSAAYLIYLGIQAWRAPVTTSPTETPSASSVQAERTGRLELFQRGFTVSISNPKNLLFFGALFPSFIDLGAPQLPQFAILSLTWLAIDLTTMSSDATMGSGIGRWFHSPRRVKLFNRTTGSFFIAAGGHLGGVASLKDADLNQPRPAAPDVQARRSSLGVNQGHWPIDRARRAPSGFAHRSRRR